MRLNLSSEIVLNKVPLAYYKPKTTVEYSEISEWRKFTPTSSPLPWKVQLI